MAVVKNITPDALSVFRSEAPPCQPGDEVTVKDENFVGRAWPKSTWEVVTPPEGYVDDDTPDAYVFVLPPEPDPEPPELLDMGGKALSDMTRDELNQIVAAAGIETTATTKADLIAAITAHTPED